MMKLLLLLCLLLVGCQPHLSPDERQQMMDQTIQELSSQYPALPQESLQDRMFTEEEIECGQHGITFLACDGRRMQEYREFKKQMGMGK